MIDRITIENFKSLRKVDLRLGRLNLFIGTNGSGKSNFLDALRVLQGIGNGFTISEIFDGKPRSATSEVWSGIRGGSAYASWVGTGRREDISIHVHGRDPTPWVLEISCRPVDGRLIREHFAVGQQTIYRYPAAAGSARLADCYLEPSGSCGGFDVDDQRSVLQQFAGTHGEQPRLAAGAGRELANMQKVDPTAARLRDYSDAPNARRMGDHGENFAALVQTIVRNDKTKAAYLSWLQELRPEEVSDVGVLHGALREPLFMLREADRDVRRLC